MLTTLGPICGASSIYFLGTCYSQLSSAGETNVGDKCSSETFYTGYPVGMKSMVTKAFISVTTQIYENNPSNSTCLASRSRWACLKRRHVCKASRPHSRTAKIYFGLRHRHYVYDIGQNPQQNKKKKLLLYHCQLIVSFIQ